MRDHGEVGSILSSSRVGAVFERIFISGQRECSTIVIRIISSEYSGSLIIFRFAWM